MMKKTLFYSLVLAVFLVVPGLAKAETVIAIVDVRILLSESDAAKSIQKQIKKHRDKFVESLAKDEKELRKLEKNLIEKKDELSPDDFAKKRKEFEEKLLETRKEAQEQKRKLDEAAADASRKLRNEITDIVEDIAEDKGYNLVLSAQNVVIGAKEINITEEVMDALNDEVSKISLKL